jgi:hypothetical protein
MLCQGTRGANTEAGGARVLRGRCDELERSLPLQPLADALDGYLRTLPTSAAVLSVFGLNVTRQLTADAGGRLRIEAPDSAGTTTVGVWLPSARGVNTQGR